MNAVLSSPVLIWRKLLSPGTSGGCEWALKKEVFSLGCEKYVGFGWAVVEMSRGGERVGAVEK